MARLLIVSFSVCPAPDRHGVALNNLLQALTGRFDVDVLTLRVANLPYQDRYLRARMLRVPVGGGDVVEQAAVFRRALTRQLEGEEYDLIHMRTAWGAGAAVLHGANATRLIYEVSRGADVEPAVEARARRALAEEEAACLERADLILVPSERARRWLDERGRGEVAVVVPPGVDVDRFDWEADLEGRPAWLPGRHATRRKNSKGPATMGPARILFTGRMAAGCGVRLLVQAAALLRQARNVRLVLAGPVAPEFRVALDQAIEEAGIGAAVDRLGALEHDDMPRLMAQATVCVAPAAPDPDTHPLAGCPTKVLEYLACRRPVVAPRRPSVTEVMKDGRDGLLFKPGDADDLANKITRLIDDADLRATLAEAGYRSVRSRFPAAATRRKLLEAYSRLAPPSTWLPPAAADEPIGALPRSVETSTARHHRVELAFVNEETSPELDDSDLVELVDERTDVITPISVESVSGSTDVTVRSAMTLAAGDDEAEFLEFVAAGALLGAADQAPRPTPPIDPGVPPRRKNQPARR